MPFASRGDVRTVKFSIIPIFLYLCTRNLHTNFTTNIDKDMTIIVYYKCPSLMTITISYSNKDIISVMSSMLSDVARMYLFAHKIYNNT